MQDRLHPLEYKLNLAEVIYHLHQQDMIFQGHEGLLLKLNDYPYVFSMNFQFQFLLKSVKPHAVHTMH